MKPALTLYVYSIISKVLLSPSILLAYKVEYLFVAFRHILFLFIQ
jgi:hypothetical protein